MTSLLELRLQDGKDQVLTCGDGDLSYSLALARHYRGTSRPLQLEATCYLDGTNLHETHPNAQPNTNALKELGATVSTGVDATFLHVTRGKLYDRIVWNFPQHPERKKIQKHRELLRLFLASAVPCLAPDALIWVTLKGGQGGTAAELPGYERSLATSWQIQEAAAGAGLLLLSAGPANVAEIVEAGYGPVGFHGDDRAFRTDGSIVHILALPATARSRCPPAFAFEPIRHRHDVSFWVDPETFQEAALLRFLRGAFEAQGVEFDASQIDAYTCPTSARSARGFRLHLWSRTEAFPKALGNALMRRVCIALAGGFDDDALCLRRFEEARVDDGARMRYPRLPSGLSPNGEGEGEGREEKEEGGASDGGDKNEGATKRRRVSNPEV